MATQQVVPVTCPACQAQFTAPVQSIVDAQDPVQKSALLQQQLNVAQCPQCGFADVLSAPILYYDLEKEVAFVFAPTDLTVSGTDQEKMIGSLTNTLVNSLPSEERKFYLFNPKRFLTLDNMIKAILEADGVPPEEFEAQQAKIKLIQEFLQTPNKEALKTKVKNHDEELDRQFFEILTASIQATQMEGDTSTAQALLSLRDMIAGWSSQGRKWVKDIDAELGQAFVKSQDELLDKLQAAQTDEEFAQLVAVGYPLLDYSFFQKLTNRIDEATKAKDRDTEQALTTLRAKVLEVKAEQEEKMRAGMEKSAKLLQEVIQSGQPDKALAKRLDEIDETFFMILTANIEEARRQKQEQAVQALTVIGNMAMQMLRERYGPETESEAEQSVGESEIEIASR
jgi:hypothetical protein